MTVKKDLQKIAHDLGIPIKKKGKGKSMIDKTIDDLCRDILALNNPNLKKLPCKTGRASPTKKTTKKTKKSTKDYVEVYALYYTSDKKGKYLFNFYSSIPALMKSIKIGNERDSIMYNKGVDVQKIRVYKEYNTDMDINDNKTILKKLAPNKSPNKKLSYVLPNNYVISKKNKRLDKVPDTIYYCDGFYYTFEYNTDCQDTGDYVEL